MFFNPLNTELHSICDLLVLLGAHHILHVSGIRVKSAYKLNSIRRMVEVHVLSAEKPSNGKPKHRGVDVLNLDAKLK